MFYALLNADQTLKRYPYTLTDLRLDNPNTSFPVLIDDKTAEEFGAYPVRQTQQPDNDYTVNINRTAVKQGDQWVEEWFSTPATPEEIAERTDNQANAVRSERNQKLANCDWTQLTDSPLNVEAKAAWAFYRENLRMIPEQQGFPWDLQWPPEPNT